MMRNAVTIVCLALALAACKGDEKKATGGNASGEILPGSASDAMLPLDTVKSQAPLAPKVESSGKADPKAGTKDTAKPAAEAKPAEASEPDAPAADDAAQ